MKFFCLTCPRAGSSVAAGSGCGVGWWMLGTLLDPWALGSIIVGKCGEVFMEREPQGRQSAQKRHFKVTGILETLNYLLNTLKKLSGSIIAEQPQNIGWLHSQCYFSLAGFFFQICQVLKSNRLNQNVSYDGNGNLRLEHSLNSVMPTLDVLSKP